MFEPGGSIAGTVTRGREAVADATVSASTPGQGGLGSFARTDASGAYRLEGLKDGTYALTAAPAHGAPKRQSVEVAGDVTLDFALPLARVAGRVVESGSSLPLAEAEVEVDSGGGGMGRARPRATTDSNGQFAIEGVEPGALTLTARRTGSVYDRRTVEAGEDATSDLEIARDSWTRGPSPSRSRPSPPTDGSPSRDRDEPSRISPRVRTPSSWKGDRRRS